MNEFITEINTIKYCKIIRKQWERQKYKLVAEVINYVIDRESEEKFYILWDFKDNTFKIQNTKNNNSYIFDIDIDSLKSGFELTFRKASLYYNYAEAIKKAKRNLKNSL